MPATGEWCAQTAELSAAQLGRLVDKTRRDPSISAAIVALARPPVYPIAPSSWTRWLPLLALLLVVGAAAAYLYR